eukprot:TRINITY_DN4577_c0_g1_i1.p1 TRINITY_DN4577_c0_g1~~TRINITY_DN4577_c0_g1_i1.p1  ORF type:complete len:151 (-),score=19.11 TRINITY_DN4577_c0_g1_i1:65-517(-)
MASTTPFVNQYHTTSSPSFGSSPTLSVNQYQSPGSVPSFSASQTTSMNGALRQPNNQYQPGSASPSSLSPSTPMFSSQPMNPMATNPFATAPANPNNNNPFFTADPSQSNPFMSRRLSGGAPVATNPFSQNLVPRTPPSNNPFASNPSHY